MRNSMVLFALLVVVAIGLAVPASARQTTVTTTDDIVSVRIAGDVYWVDHLVWKFQIFSGTGQQTPVVKLPEGFTIKLRLDAVGTDGDKPIMLAADKGEGIVPTEARREICYTVGPNDDWIVPRTLYKGAVRTDSPLFVFVIGWGSKVDHADRKGAWPFSVESTKVYGIKCAADAKEAIVRLDCVGHEPTMLLGDAAGSDSEFGPATIPSMIPLEIVDPAAYARFVAEQKVLDANQDAGILAAIALGNQNARAIADLQAEQERNRRAHEAPAVRLPAHQQTAAQSTTQPVNGQQYTLKERLLAQYAGQNVVVFQAAPGRAGSYKYWFEKPGCRPVDFTGRIAIAENEETEWTTMSTYISDGYVRFGVTLGTSKVPPGIMYSLDQAAGQPLVIIVGGE